MDSTGGDMPRLCMLLVLSCVWMTACTGRESPSGPTTISAADWSKVGETEIYVSLRRPWEYSESGRNRHNV